jgi:hypothetical protein
MCKTWQKGTVEPSAAVAAASNRRESRQFSRRPSAPAMRPTTAADGTDGKSPLPSALPSGLNRNQQNDLQSADGTDGTLLSQERITPPVTAVTAEKVAVTRAVTP